MESNIKLKSQESKMNTKMCKIKMSELIVQLLATLCISFQGCQCGFIAAWPSYTAALFRSNETILTMPMSSAHISMLGSLSNVGGLLISPFCSYAYNAFGRKYGTILLALPFVLTWTIITFSSNVYLVLFAMAVVGISFSGVNISVIFISEIANDSIRGGLSACPTSAYYAGLFISNFLSAYLSYKQVVYTFLTLSVLAVALLMLLKESPVYLVLVGREKEAAESISFYKRLHVTSKEVKVEISKIKEQLDPKLNENYELVATNESEKITNQPTKRISSWNFLKNSKSSQRSLFKMLSLMTATSMMGPVVFQAYGEFIFMEALPSVDPNKGTVGVGLVFLIASLICILAVDKCGRKSLLVYTSIACAICSLVFGSILQYRWAPDWLTALSIYGYCFSYTSGAVNIPFVLIAEVFLPEVRSLCTTITMVSLWVASFASVASFQFLVELLGMGPVFYVFSVICLLTAIYSAFCVPETKGLSVTEIQKLFLKERQLSKM